MRLLIYGFKHYGPYQDNISEQVIHALPEYDEVVKQVFDVKFNSRMFYNTLDKVKPEIILGLGQHPRARKIRIERKAKNIHRTEQGEYRCIDKAGPAIRFANLSLPDTDLTTITYDAGTYVCNYSMYIMGEYSERSGGRYGFIHIPRQSNIDVVTRYIKHACKSLF